MTIIITFQEYLS